MSLKKPHLKPYDLIQKMRVKGITFNNNSMEYAEKYLIEKNNFLRLYSYRKNFQKSLNGEHKGEYLNLDFSHLKALAVFDLQIRKQILSICIDIEHSLKLLILSDFESEIENDGYKIVTAFLKKNNHTARELINKSINHNGYTCDLLGKYIHKVNNNINAHLYYYQESDLYCIDMPIWVLLESITFGGLIRFYKFYYEYYEKKEPLSSKILYCIKSLRNACAHNNCILNNLYDKETKPISTIRTFITGTCNITKDMAKSRMSCRVLHEYACVIYVAYKYVPNSIFNHDLKKLKESLEHFERNHLSLFKKNDLILSSFKFLKKTIDISNKIGYNNKVM